MRLVAVYRRNDVWCGRVELDSPVLGIQEFVLRQDQQPADTVWLQIAEQFQANDLARQQSPLEIEAEDGTILGT